VYRVIDTFETVIVKIYYEEDEETLILADLAVDPPERLVYAIPPSKAVMRFVYSLGMQ
jgi:hypothetical protein